MDDATLKKLKPCLWILAALLLGYDVFFCTSSVVNLARQNLHWGWWSWTPCFYNVYLLVEVILSKNKNALIASGALLALEFAVDICNLLMSSEMSGGGYDVMGWGYMLLYLAGMIALLVCEDNVFLKRLNLVAVGITVVAVFSTHL